MKHFDAEALLDEVAAQPVGLLITTNHPHGFKRLMYLAQRKRKSKSVLVASSPSSPNQFMLINKNTQGTLNG